MLHYIFNFGIYEAHEKVLYVWLGYANISMNKERGYICYLI